ncbi:hypothetical protein SASPL_128417 [Salvia splendens]|uniref:non-specific serine/threonine protein kinase n=1 Tax=Salvia splendens TaxID=180675 RepID=A0A8X8XCM2_SALSN|nr:hypothetical protein SASPL_128417 [Salvia splendens]
MRTHNTISCLDFSCMDAITLLLFLLPFHLHLFQAADSTCPQSSVCGNHTLKFPFTIADNPGCGLITVDGCNSDPPYPVIHIGDGDLGFAILNHSSTIDCLTPVYYNIPASKDKTVAPEGCSLVQLPMNSSGNSDDLFSMITASFTLEWSVSDKCRRCFNAGGQCLTANDNKFSCRKGDTGLRKNLLLRWEKLFEIALGIARGLEYLHQGCNTRILHLDIKPQNILLDEEMNPRISDFGLAKLCPNRSSIVSLIVARGTIGYIAPEVFSRNFGEVFYKSDVYSYGMLILEMAGGRKTIDPRDADCSSEIYFPNYLYKQLEMNAERDSGLCGIMNEEDESQHVKRKLIIVGLW